LELYEREQLFERAAGIADYWESALHSLRSAAHVIDIRNLGLMGAIELQPREGQPGSRAMDAFRHCFDAGLLIRVTGDIIALSPPLIISAAQIDEVVEQIGDVLAALS
jgi:beta-alanine--pyruvate transaminase